MFIIFGFEPFLWVGYLKKIGTLKSFSNRFLFSLCSCNYSKIEENVAAGNGTYEQAGKGSLVKYMMIVPHFNY